MLIYIGFHTAGIKIIMQTQMHCSISGTPLFRTPLGHGAQSILNKGGVLVSRVVLYTSLCSWSHPYSVLIKGDVLILVVSLWRGSTVLCLCRLDCNNYVLIVIIHAK